LTKLQLLKPQDQQYLARIYEALAEAEMVAEIELHHINISILIAFATAVSAALELLEETAFLAFLYDTAEGVEGYTDTKTRGSIRKLLDLVPKKATLLADGREQKLLATNL
jgi:cation transport ATPase